MRCYGRGVLMNDSGSRVLVTGAGGWLGGEIAARLVAAGADVTALVRRVAEVRGNDGALVPVSRLLPGDVAAPRLGWDAAAWRAHAGAFDLIVHCAALTKFDAEPALAHAVNVVGTQNVVALAQAGRTRAGGTRLLHVSTAYVNGGLGGIVLEGDRPEGPFTNAYEASKARAELVVADAGLEAVIVRPSIVLGDWATGAVRSFGTFYYLLKVLAEGRVARMAAAPGATLDLVPVDHVVGGIMALIGQFEAAAGGVFHLVSGAPTPISAFGETLSRFSGLAVPEFVVPRDKAPGPVRGFERLIAPYAPYFLRDPRFDDRGFRALTGLVCPPVGAGWWERLVAFAIEAGFVRQGFRGDLNGIVREAAMPSSAGSR